MQMGEAEELRQRARELRRLGEEARQRARRLRALEDLRWRSRAAELFRSRVHSRFSAQLSLAASLAEAAAAFDRLAAVHERGTNGRGTNERGTG
jgi:hypothetical protein